MVHPKRRRAVQRHDRIKQIGDQQIRETLALLKILVVGDRQIAAGEVQPAAKVVGRLRERHLTR